MRRPMALCLQAMASMPRLTAVLLLFAGACTTDPAPQTWEPVGPGANAETVGEALSAIAASDDAAELRRALWIVLMQPSAIPLEQVRDIAQSHADAAVRLWAARAVVVGSGADVSEIDALLASEPSAINRRELTAIRQTAADALGAP